MQGPLDVSTLFKGHALDDVALFLRWLYSPQLATPAALGADSGALAPVLRLAHKLGAQGLIRRLTHFWTSGEFREQGTLWGRGSL